LPDHSRSALLLRLFGNGQASFFVTDSLVQDQADQATMSMGNGSDGLIYVPGAGPSGDTQFRRCFLSSWVLKEAEVAGLLPISPSFRSGRQTMLHFTVWRLKANCFDVQPWRTSCGRDRGALNLCRLRNRGVCPARRFLPRAIAGVRNPCG
jgi:hypothetical protein